MTEGADGEVPSEPDAIEGRAAAGADEDPWLDEDDLEPLDLGGVIWLPLAKRVAIGLVAAALVAALVLLLL